MKKNALIAAAVLAAVVYVKMSSCAPSQRDILGRWSATDRPYHLAFSADGRCQIATIGAPHGCTYTLDGATLALHVDGGRNITARAEMRGDTLELYSDNTYFHFTRD